MARSIDYRSTLTFPAEQVYAAMTNREYLEARLRELGGPGSALLEHGASPESARYKLRQGVSESDLPPVVGKVVGGNLTIERTETLVRGGAGRYSGDVDVAIPGAPANAAGTVTLTDQGDGSVFAVHADVTVNVPIFGGKIEEIVAEQVRRLMEAETAFTITWLNRH
jgi:hypothetical protein